MPIACHLLAQMILNNNLLRDIVDFNADIFISYHGSVQVEIFNVQCHVPGILSGDYAVDVHFYQSQIGSGMANISGLVDFVATNCETSAMYFRFVWL